MNRRRRSTVAFSYFCLVLGFAAVAMADDSESLPPQGPYFQVASTDPTVDRLPLKSTDAKVRISGVTADVVLTQRYRNEGTRPIEARYVFPGSTEAAVHALRFTLGSRQIDAKIREKQQARLEYLEAKKTGHTSALLEQDRPNVFSMNVANILPGDEVDVELRYTERLVPTDGRYEFVFPTVVGPRYRSPAAAGAPVTSMPFLHEGVASRTAFTLSAVIDSPLAVSDVTSTSHAVTVRGAGSKHVEVKLESSGQDNDRDFLLDYRLAGSRIAGGLLLDTGADENTFLAIIEPPKVVAPAEVSPRDYIFVVDVSGSMQGYPLETARTLLRRLIGDLRPNDTFNVMLFSGDSRTLSPNSVPATAANIELATRLLSEQRGGGATEIVPALRRVVALPKNPELSRTVVVVTDGYVDVEREVFDLIRRNLGNTNVFAFGIGTSVNRHLIEGIARAGRGEPFVVTRPAEAEAQADRLRRIIDRPVLTQVTARFHGMDVYDVEPAVLPDVMAGRPIIVVGKWHPSKKDALPPGIVIEGRTPTGTFRQTSYAGSVTSHPALPLLWARDRIRSLSDQEALDGGDAQRAAITALGLKYGLLTSYTSFVAIDRVVRNDAGLTPVDQPSPMPSGVSDAAIGMEVPTTPEPAAWLSIAVATGLIALALARRRIAGIAARVRS